MKQCTCFYYESFTGRSECVDQLLSWRMLRHGRFKADTVETIQATNSGPDGSCLSLKTGTQTRTKPRTKDLESTGIELWQKLDYTVRAGAFTREWRRVCTRVRSPLFFFAAFTGFYFCFPFSISLCWLAQVAFSCVQSFKAPLLNTGPRACCSPALVLLHPVCFHQEGAALLLLLFLLLLLLLLASRPCISTIQTLCIYPHLYNPFKYLFSSHINFDNRSLSFSSRYGL